MNPPVVRRRQAMRAIEELIASRTADQSDVDLANADQELRRLVEAQIVALTDVFDSKGQPAAERLADAELGLRALEAQLREAAAVRPSARPRAYLSVARELRRLWPLYLAAACTSDIGQAERLAAQAQVTLDGTTRHLNDLAIDLRAVEHLADVRRQPDLVTRIFEATRIRYPGRDLAELNALGQQQFRTVSGREAASGSSVDFVTIQLVAAAYLDPHAMDDKLRELATQPISGDRVRQVAEFPDAIADLGVCRRDLFEALTQFDKIASSESDPAIIARRLAKTVGELYEAAVPLYAWCRLLANDVQQPDAYQRIVAKDATELTRQLAATLPATFQDLPGFLRNAGHHGRAFDVHADTGTVEIRLRSHTETMTASAYVNLAYAMLESLLALQWSISNWLEHAGIAVPMPHGAAEAMGLSQPALAAFWFREAKGIAVESTLEDGRWTISGGIAEHDILTAAIAMAQLADARCHVVEVRMTDSTAEPISIALDDYQAFTAAAGGTGAQNALGLLELRHRFTRGGKCLLTTNDIEFSIVAIGFAVVSGAMEQVTSLRRARQLALSHGEPDLAALATRALATIRNGDDFALKLDFASRTRSFVQPDFPEAPAAEIWIGSSSAHSRPCD